MAGPCGTITLFIPFVVIHAQEVPASSIEVTVHQQLDQGKVPCAVVKDWEDGCLDHSHLWLISQRRLERPAVKLPETHAMTAMIIRSRTFVIGEGDIEKDLKLVIERLLSLRGQGYYITTTKQCRLQVSLGIQGGTLPPEKLLNLCFMVTAFERCLDGLLMAHCVKHTAKYWEYSIERQLHDVAGVGSVEELARCMSAGTDKTFKIEDASTVTFGNHHGTLDIDHILVWCTTLMSLFRYCCSAEHGEIRDLVQSKCYDLRFSSLDFLSAISAESKVVAYYEEDFQADSSLGGADRKARSCQPKVVRHAMSNKYYDGDYGTDLLQHNPGMALFPEDFDDYSTKNYSEQSEDESVDEDEPCPSLTNTSRSVSRSLTPPSTQEIDAQAHWQLEGVFDMSSLKACLPQTPAEKSQVRHNDRRRRAVEIV